MSARFRGRHCKRSCPKVKFETIGKPSEIDGDKGKTVYAYNPGLLCMMPPSAKMVVAVI
jgi:hypothetical protein